MANTAFTVSEIYSFQHHSRNEMKQIEYKTTEFLCELFFNILKIIQQSFSGKKKRKITTNKKTIKENCVRVQPRVRPLLLLFPSLPLPHLHFLFVLPTAVTTFSSCLHFPPYTCIFISSRIYLPHGLITPGLKCRYLLVAFRVIFSIKSLPLINLLEWMGSR